jgi:hypothetical protein
MDLDPAVLCRGRKIAVGPRVRDLEAGDFNARRVTSCQLGKPLADPGGTRQT